MSESSVVSLACRPPFGMTFWIAMCSAGVGRPFDDESLKYDDEEDSDRLGCSSDCWAPLAAAIGGGGTAGTSKFTDWVHTISFSLLHFQRPKLWLLSKSVNPKL